MSFFPKSLETLIDKFASLPGVGRKSAQRLAFHILSLPEGEAEAFADEKLTNLVCPACGGGMSASRWVNQGDQRYMNLFVCPEHGSYLVRVKFRKDDAGLWCASRLVYEADDGLCDFYKQKATQARRRGRGHGSRKNRPAK